MEHQGISYKLSERNCTNGEKVVGSSDSKHVVYYHSERITPEECIVCAHIHTNNTNLKHSTGEVLATSPS